MPLARVPTMAQMTGKISHSRTSASQGGAGQDSPAGELTTTHRAQHVSRNFRSGHHDIKFRLPAEHFPTPTF